MPSLLGALFALVAVSPQDVGADERQKILAGLRDRFADQGPFTAEMTFDGQEGQTVLKLTLDLKAQKSLISAKLDSSPERFVFVEGWTLRSWGAGEEPTAMDFPGLEEYERRMQGILGDLRELSGKKSTSPPLEPFLLLGLSPPEPGQVPRLRLALGKSGEGVPASWFTDLSEAKGLRFSKGPDDVAFEWPDGSRAVRLDAATGFPRVIRSGKARLSLTRFTRLSAFPAVALPKEFVWSDPPESETRVRLTAFQEAFEQGVLAALKDWDALAAAGRTEALGKALRRWGAAYSDTWHEWALRQGAREYIAVRERAGVPFKDLAANVERESTLFEAQLARDSNRKAGRKYLDERVAELKRDLQDHSSEVRRHADFLKLLDSSLDPEAVEQERSRGSRASPRKALQDALERRRQL